MLITGYKARLAAACLIAAIISLASQRATAQTQTVVGAFDGNLSTSLGFDWEVLDVNGAPAPIQFVPGVTGEAAEIAHLTGWTMPIRLNPPAGDPMTNLITLFASSDTLEFDVRVGPEGSDRQMWVILNSNATGWSQPPQVDPVVNGDTHIVIDLTDPGHGVNWKQAAQDALVNPVAQEYWQLFLVIQGPDLALTADFDIDSDVDGDDFLTWQQNYGNQAAGPDQGDTNFDAIVDELDLAVWNGEFGRNNLRPKTAFDNVTFFSAGGAAAAIPEPSTIVGGLLGACFVGLAARRRRVA
jgi:hypothetical protein